MSRVMYIRANLISSCGLFPASGGKGSVIPKVHTELGGDWWVEREVSASELLAMWDVPEPLVTTLSSGKERCSLLKSCEVPKGWNMSWTVFTLCGVATPRRRSKSGV